MFSPKSLVLLSIFSVALGENGTLPRSGVPLITAGSDTHNRDHSKHIASIRLGKPQFWGDNHLCGGTFIAPDMVLTAAHCMINDTTNMPFIPQELTVVSGSVNRFHQTKDTVELKVSQVIVHKDFSVEIEMVNDIAILKLEQRATEIFPNSAEILPINHSPVATDTICTVMGWGLIFRDGPTSPILLYANVTVISPFECKIQHLHVSPFRNWGIICAGGEGDPHLDRDACFGDSGGPLVCKGRLAGIVAFGTHDDCGSKGKPGGYTDVYYYRRWIKEHSPESSARSNVPAPIVVMFTMFWFKLSHEMLLNTF